MVIKRRSIIFLLLWLMIMIVPAVSAQRQIPSFSEIMSHLGPRTGIDLLFDILLYAIFLIGLVTLLLIPDKQLLATLTTTAVIAVSVITKIGVPTIFDQCSFAPLVLNVIMFTFPLIVAGMVRQRGATPKALAPAILLGLLGGAYFFLYWAVVQSKQCSITG
jgi:hypothetical protein